MYAEQYLQETIKRALPEYPDLEIEKIKKALIREAGGTSLSIPQDIITRIDRNINILALLPAFGKKCPSTAVRELAKKYHLSESQIRRIHREANKTYLKIEELYDHELISEQQHGKFIAVLRKKLPAHILGKTL